MRLPEGYRLERDPDVWSLYAPDGSVVARFIAGAPDSEIEAEAEAHQRGEDHREMFVAVAIGLLYGGLLAWGAGLGGPLW